MTDIELSPDVAEAEPLVPRFARRSLLIGGFVAVGAALAGPGRALLPFIGGDPEPLVRSSLEAHLGERFVLRHDSGDVDLEVAAIRDLPAVEASDPEGQFGVVFRTAGSTDLGQGTYSMSSAAFGDVALFLTPASAPGAPVQELEALFNSPASERRS